MLLSQPINNTETAKKDIYDNIYYLLNDQLDLILLGLKKKGMYQDPVGLLDNNHILGNRSQIKHSNIIPILIKRLLTEREKDITMSRLTAKQKAANLAQAKQDATNATAVETTTPPVTTPEVVVPPVEASKELVTNKTPLVQAINKVVEEATEVDINYSFHTPYINKVVSILDTMNGMSQEDPEFTKSKEGINSIVRTWVSNFYKHVMSSAQQEANTSYITKDVYDILEGDNPFSDPMYFEYDNVFLLQPMFDAASAKFKVENGNEVSVYAGVKTILDLQDPTKPIVEIPTNTAAKESITVDKTTGDVTIKKDNIIVRFAKAVWRGTKAFFKNIGQQWLRLWNWCTSWFKSEKKVIITEAEYKELQAQGKAAA